MSAKNQRTTVIIFGVVTLVAAGVLSIFGADALILSAISAAGTGLIGFGIKAPGHDEGA